MTMNPCNPALLGRADNEVIEVGPKRSPLTSDADIERRRWIMVDFDPKRPAKVSATDEEVFAALARAREGKAYLKLRWGADIPLATSGNGAHLLIPVDLLNDQESRVLVEGLLKALSFRFSDDRIEVDESTFNAARITKPYGVMARKGSNVERIGRVHRRSALLEAPEAVKPVSRNVLEAVANEKPEEPPRGSRANAGQSGVGDFELEDGKGRNVVRV